MPREINFDNDILYCIREGIPFDTIESNFAITWFRIFINAIKDKKYRDALLIRYNIWKIK